MVKLGEIKEQYNFEPEYTFPQLEQNLPQTFETQTIADSRLYRAIRKLTEKAYPTKESDYEKRWYDFYLPLKRKGYFVLVPLSIILYDKRFFFRFSDSQVEVSKGNRRRTSFIWV